jgi:hypothetical protein
MPSINEATPNIGTKIVNIAGKDYTVTLLPPGPEWHDEMVWSKPKAGTRHATLRSVADLNGGFSTLVGTD